MKHAEIAQKKAISLPVEQAFIATIVMIEAFASVNMKTFAMVNLLTVYGTCSTCYDLHESECRANENCTFCETSGVCMPPEDTNLCPNCSSFFLFF